MNEMEENLDESIRGFVGWEHWIVARTARKVGDKRIRVKRRQGRTWHQARQTNEKSCFKSVQKLPA